MGSPRPPPEIAELAKRLLARDRDAVSQALNLVDDRRPAERARALALLECLEASDVDERSHRIGVTGAPGAGKSTLIDALVRELRARGRSVGIIAVDPSSQRSGGALLGDRFRVRSGARDPGVFLRSMAARERLGGLADATHASLLILSAVFDAVVVETVGVGQSEADVAQLCDTLLFVVQPASGDLLQFMKAGLMELPDVFAVNKADQGPAAQRSAGELAAGLGLGEGRGDGEPPVLLTSARDGTGVPELLGELDRHQSRLRERGGLAPGRRRGRLAQLVGALERRYGSHGMQALGGRDVVLRRLADSAGTSLFARSEQVAAEIEDALRKPR